MTFKMKLWPDIAPINHLTSKMTTKLNMTPKLKMTPKKEDDCKIKDYPKTKEDS